MDCRSCSNGIESLIAEENVLKVAPRVLYDVVGR